MASLSIKEEAQMEWETAAAVVIDDDLKMEM